MPNRPPSRPDARRYATLAALAAKTAVTVGAAIRADDVEIVTHKKGRANFATAADHAAEAAIKKRLWAHDASIPILAEESADLDLRSADRLWVVDPIDGTLNFSRALPFSCVASCSTRLRDFVVSLPSSRILSVILRPPMPPLPLT